MFITRIKNPIQLESSQYQFFLFGFLEKQLIILVKVVFWPLIENMLSIEVGLLFVN